MKCDTQVSAQNSRKPCVTKRHVSPPWGKGRNIPLVPEGPGLALLGDSSFLIIGVAAGLILEHSCPRSSPGVSVTHVSLNSTVVSLLLCAAGLLMFLDI